jgi:hypothetical protein
MALKAFGKAFGYDHLPEEVVFFFGIVLLLRKKENSNRKCIKR